MAKRENPEKRNERQKRFQRAKNEKLARYERTVARYELALTTIRDTAREKKVRRIADEALEPKQENDQ